MELLARYPLRKADGSAFGAILCLRAADAEVKSEPVRVPRETLDIVGRQLWMMKCAEPNSLVRMLGLQRSGKRWYRHPFVWSIAIALSLLMLVPMPLKVKSECQVQPRHRRYVCVPYEGRLEEALTEPGEIVRKGQLLARMDGREIQFEISGLTAEMRRIGKDRDTALAAYDTAASQIAALESQRLQLKIDLLEQRLENLEIRSPVDGVVMGGDPRKLEGARMSIGDTLLEVGPMDQMIVELSILDEDISHVRVGQQVRYRLSAQPWKALEGPITLIHPRSEARDGKKCIHRRSGIAERLRGHSAWNARSSKRACGLSSAGLEPVSQGVGQCRNVDGVVTRTGVPIVLGVCGCHGSIAKQYRSKFGEDPTSAWANELAPNRERQSLCDGVRPTAVTVFSVGLSRMESCETI